MVMKQISLLLRHLESEVSKAVESPDHCLTSATGTPDAYGARRNYWAPHSRLDAQ